MSPSDVPDPTGSEPLAEWLDDAGPTWLPDPEPSATDALPDWLGSDLPEEPESAPLLPSVLLAATQVTPVVAEPAPEPSFVADPEPVFAPEPGTAEAPPECLAETPEPEPAAVVEAPFPTTQPGLLEALLDAPAPARRREARRGAGARTDVQHLVFSLGDTDYAVPLSSVLEIGRVPPVFAVPNTPNWLLGVANLRGDIVSLVDLHSYLGLPAQSRNTANQRLLLARAAGGELVAGLVVDRLGGIRDLAPTPAARLAARLHERLAAHVRGIDDDAGRMLVRLDLEGLLIAPELRRFEPA